MLSKNTSNSLKADFIEKLRFQEANAQSLYLGLPNIIGRNKSTLFGFLKENLRDRIQGWEKKVLSKGGTEILLSTSAQTLLNYVMGVFLLPISLCQDLEKMMCKFWWHTNSSKDRGIYWLSWDNMSKKKSSGGMGFRKLHDFNIALIGKQGWRLLTHPEKLVSKVYKAR
ncbi:putative mitochondrial protein AtMg00310 [Apium graveolens]|uniref:putative mitochondrial protein AtMg00310 n=1 Tax=Apium graveolens TaxID=4045 RepID=UPI003D7AB28E